jgi:hypothetical protein
VVKIQSEIIIRDLETVKTRFMPVIGVDDIRERKEQKEESNSRSLITQLYNIDIGLDTIKRRL